MRPAPNDMGALAVAVRKSGNQELVGRADRLLMAGSGGPANGYYRPQGASDATLSLNSKVIEADIRAAAIIV